MLNEGLRTLRRLCRGIPRLLRFPAPGRRALDLQVPRHPVSLRHCPGALVVVLLLVCPVSRSQDTPAPAPEPKPKAEAQKTAALPVPPPFVYAPLNPKPEFRRVAREILRSLDRYHYLDLAWDDEFSERLFKGYLDNLDPGHSTLTQKDLQEFSRWRKYLDDALRKLDLKPAHVIFNRYRKNALHNVEKQLQKLEKDGLYFDFSRQEEFVVDREELPWPANQLQVDELWRKQLKNHALSLRLEQKSDEHILQSLKKSLHRQLRHLQQMLPKDVFSTYMNSVTELYDSHTNYMSPTKAENFNINMRLSLEGIGAVLRQRDEYTQVVSISKGGPAERQGELQPGDRIVGVGQEGKEMQNIVGWRLNEVIEQIRGRRGTRVRLQVLPAESKDPVETKIISIVRDKIKLEKQAAQKEILEMEHGGQLRRIGVIDLPSFYLDFRARDRNEPDYRSTSRDVLRLLEELRQEQVDAVIIDLRNNGGGSLEEANALVGLFIERGPVVQVRMSNGRVIRQGKLKRSPWYEKPMAVLLNRLSASASEIFAAAIQDYGRGLIIGGPSYGKGTVQSLHRLSAGQVKVTDAKFYRISGGSTQLRGVIPDILFPRVYEARDVGESSLENALPWDQIRSVRHRNYYELQKIVPELQARHEQRTREHPEFLYLKARLEQKQEEREANKIVSLNEGQRRAEEKKWKEARTALKKIRKPQKQENKTATGDNKKKEKPDAFLQEAGQVVLDSLVLLQTPVADVSRSELSESEKKTGAASAREL